MIGTEQTRSSQQVFAGINTLNTIHKFLDIKDFPTWASSSQASLAQVKTSLQMPYVNHPRLKLIQVITLLSRVQNNDFAPPEDVKLLIAEISEMQKLTQSDDEDISKAAKTALSKLSPGNELIEKWLSPKTVLKSAYDGRQDDQIEELSQDVIQKKYASFECFSKEIGKLSKSDAYLALQCTTQLIQSKELSALL